MGGTVLAVAVAVVVITRMAALDAEIARSAQTPAAEVAPVVASPPATPEPATEPEGAPVPDEPAVVADPTIPAAPAAPVSLPEKVDVPVVTPPVARAKPKPAEATPAPPPEHWWPPPNPGALNLLHAGYLQAYPAIVLLFDGAFESANGIDRAITVARADGSQVGGAWQVGPNGRTLILPVPLGRYRVEIAPILADAKGQAVGRSLGGDVLVR